MNCRMTPIDARTASVWHGLVPLNGSIGHLLQPCPGEGPGA